MHLNTKNSTLLVCSVWIGGALVLSLYQSFFSWFRYQEFALKSELISHMILAFTGILSTPFVVKVFKAYPIERKLHIKTALIHLVAALAFSVLHKLPALLIDFQINRWIDPNFLKDWSLGFIIKSNWIVFLNALILSIILYFVILMMLGMLKARKHSTGKVDSRSPNTMKVKAADGSIHILPIAEITSLEASGNYINVTTRENSFTVRRTMDSLHKTLPSPFVRIHRSYIINGNQVVSYKHIQRGEYLLKLQNNRSLTSSRSYSKSLQHIISRLD